MYEVKVSTGADKVVRKWKKSLIITSHATFHYFSTPITLFFPVPSTLFVSTGSQRYKEPEKMITFSDP